MIVAILHEPAQGDEIEGQFPVPSAYYGPFDNHAAAVSWIENDCPEDEKDLATVGTVDSLEFVNDPKSIFGDQPDEDIRDDDDTPG